MGDVPTMVEKVAHAIRMANPKNSMTAGESFAAPRAAIAAMRDPGETVIAAVENMAEERYNAAPDMQRWYGEDVWAAGIDAALASPEPIDGTPGAD